MILAIIFGALVSQLYTGSISYDDCKAKNFEPKACKTSEIMKNLGNK